MCCSCQARTVRECGVRACASVQYKASRHVSYATNHRIPGSIRRAVGVRHTTTQTIHWRPCIAWGCARGNKFMQVVACPLRPVQPTPCLREQKACPFTQTLSPPAVPGVLEGRGSETVPMRCSFCGSRDLQSRPGHAIASCYRSAHHLVVVRCMYGANLAPVPELPRNHPENDDVICEEVQHRRA